MLCDTFDGTGKTNGAQISKHILRPITKVCRISASFSNALTVTVLCFLSVSHAFAGPYSSLVVFGDSLSDVGNIAASSFDIYPGQYYYQDRFSNGPVFTESLSAGLGLGPSVRSTAGGNNFAYGGARTSGTGGLEGIFIRDVDEQVTQFLATRTADPNSLFVVFSGANDFVGGQTNVNVPANNLAADIQRLISAGARQFLVMNLPLLGYTPRYNGNVTTSEQFNTRTAEFNAALDVKIENIATTNPALTFFRLDVASLFNDAIANPAAFGLINVTQSAAPGLQPGASSYNTNLIVSNHNQYLFWDDLHPTTAVHAILAQRALALVALPGDYNRDGEVDAADFVVWRNSFGQTGSFLRADGNENNQIDLSDFEFWKAHFGLTASSGTSIALTLPPPPFGAAVPEPGATCLLAFGLLVSLTSRRLP